MNRLNRSTLVEFGVDEILILKESDVPNYGLPWCFLSFLFFVGSRYILQRNVPQRVLLQGPTTAWKWVNIANSLVHSLITGVGSLIGFYLRPELAANIITNYSTLCHALCCVSVGYFVMDLIDMLMNNRKRSTYELVLHHLMAGACFSISALTRYYIGFASIALLIELNSIFLHWRQLLLIQLTPKKELYYRTISVLNLITFIVFRMLSLAYMTQWLARNAHIVPQPDITIGCVADGGVAIMSTILFIRLIQADFLSKRDRSEEINLKKKSEKEEEELENHNYITQNNHHIKSN